MMRTIWAGRHPLGYSARHAMGMHGVRPTAGGPRTRLTAATGGEPVLVPSTVPQQTVDLLSALRPLLTSVELFGGTAVISPALAVQVTTAVNGRAQ